MSRSITITGSFHSHPTTCGFQSHPLFPEDNSINFVYKNNTEKNVVKKTDSRFVIFAVFS